MAGLPNTPSGVIRLIHRFTIGADTNVDTSLYFAYTGGPPSATNLNAIAGGAHSNFSGLQTYMAASRTLTSIVAQDLANMTAPTGSWTGSAVGGTSETAPMPASLCCVASYKVAARYRGGHPRGYWPLGADSMVASPGQWNASSIGTLTTALVTYIGAISALTGVGVTMGGQVAVSYYLGSSSYVASSGKTKYRENLRATPVVRPVTSAAFNTRIGSQRRRMKKA